MSVVRLGASCNLPDDETQRVNVGASERVELIHVQRVVEQLGREVASKEDFENL